jgi:hypothetical protein
VLRASSRGLSRQRAHPHRVRFRIRIRICSVLRPCSSLLSVFLRVRSRRGQLAVTVLTDSRALLAAAGAGAAGAPRT